VPGENEIMIINDDEIAAAGFDETDKKKIASIARRISKAAKEAEEMGIEIFGGTGSGSLRFNDGGWGGSVSAALIIANLDGSFDGGCGASSWDENGLLRGE
jgi:hypothetical protein